VDETPSPIVTPKASRIDESAVAMRAPRITGVQLKYLEGTSMEAAAGSIDLIISAQPEE
jgi:hypothetical protein